MSILSLKTWSFALGLDVPMPTSAPLGPIAIFDADALVSILKTPSLSTHLKKASLLKYNCDLLAAGASMVMPA